MRVLITGSREWTYERTIRLALEISSHGHDPGEVTIVHGACPTGADAIADALAREMGFQLETHPADWSAHGKRAGFLRNAEMAELGADLCIAFPQGESKGTRMMMDLARKKGIVVYDFGN